MTMPMDPSAIRNFKDFLMLYNHMSELCFSRCVDNVNSRTLDKNEIDCVDDCAQKFIYFNNKLMRNFVQAQSVIVNKRIEQVEAEEKKQMENKIVSDAGPVAVKSS